jgi:hypothetical protein
MPHHIDPDTDTALHPFANASGGAICESCGEHRTWHVTLCAYIERATDGPCAEKHCGRERSDFRHDLALAEIAEAATYLPTAAHDWQGRIVTVCGHGAETHFTDHEGHSWCGSAQYPGCYDDDNLAEPDGAEHEFVPGAVECPACTGGVVGYHEEGDEYEICKTCGGFGVVREDGKAFSERPAILR